MHEIHVHHERNKDFPIHVCINAKIAAKEDSRYMIRGRV